MELLDGWGLKIPNTTVQLEARVVDSETVYFGQNRFHKVVGYDANWNRQATNFNMLCVVSRQKDNLIRKSKPSKNILLINLPTDLYFKNVQKYSLFGITI